MSLSQGKADELLALAKEAARKEVFTWLHITRQEELLVALDDKEIQFLLSFKRNPFEITAQLRTRDRNFPLARIDNAAQHVNPDGEVLRGPHMHWYREGDGLAWASLVFRELPNLPPHSCFWYSSRDEALTPPEPEISP